MKDMEKTKEFYPNVNDSEWSYYLKGLKDGAESKEMQVTRLASELKEVKAQMESKVAADDFVFRKHCEDLTAKLEALQAENQALAESYSKLQVTWGEQTVRLNAAIAIINENDGNLLMMPQAIQRILAALDPKPSSK